MVRVERLRIQNYKCFRRFEIDFNEHLNIIVGNNEEGKSTILEALHLCLSGMLNGKYSFSEVVEPIFNKDAVDEYINSLQTTEPLLPPTIIIEVYLKGDDIAILEGNNNSMRASDKCGIVFKVAFNESYLDSYQNLVNSPEGIKSLPVEYYKIERYSFAKAPLTNRQIPLKSVIIDSSSNRSQNGSDVYISKIIKDSLDENELTALSLSYRKLKTDFGTDASIDAINRKITQGSGITDKEVSISVDMSMRNSWDTVLMTFIDGIPFPQVGKGEQCIIKTNLALSHQRTQVSNLILIEEPENHLSHTNLNVLLSSITEKCKEKQVIITTHSNFVANKLGLDNLILLSNKHCLCFNSLHCDVVKYFKKLPGYDTLRLILSKAAILVEGPSDELIVQRAYKDKFGLLPIEQGVDVISVRGLSFKRFLDIAGRIGRKVAVITDNDSDYQQNVKDKYVNYDDVDCIEIFADPRNELNTLEPQFIDANIAIFDDLRKIIGLREDKYPDRESVLRYMINNKAEWALKVFEDSQSFNYPQYVINALEWINERE